MAIIFLVSSRLVGLDIVEEIAFSLDASIRSQVVYDNMTGNQNHELEELCKQLAAVQARLVEKERRCPSIEDEYRSMTDRHRFAIFQGGNGANNFELKMDLVNVVQHNSFGGHPTEDSNVHIAQFLELCDTSKKDGVPPDAIRL